MFLLYSLISPNLTCDLCSWYNNNEEKKPKTNTETKKKRKKAKLNIFKQQKLNWNKKIHLNLKTKGQNEIIIIIKIIRKYKTIVTVV